MSDLAQEELDRYLNNNEKITGHPEDQNNSDNESSTHSSDGDGKKAKGHDDYHHSDSSDNDTAPPKMVARSTAYKVPSTVFEANTGPKGVIADAQSYERARKRSFRRTLMSMAGFDPSRLNKEQTSPNLSLSGASSPEDDDEAFMRTWREARAQELMQRSKRRNSPSKRVYGTVETVDANGYLDAIERVPLDTVVVVCIYDPESTFSNIVEDSLTTIARKHSTTRFVKLHHEIAEMDHVSAPALLAYRGGDVFTSIINIPKQLPKGRPCSADSLEDLLKESRILS